MDSPHPAVVPRDHFFTTKRKLDDAFFELDNSVIPSELVDDPRPLKKINISRSIYSTLTKYGIPTKSSLSPSATMPTSLTKAMPHLSAILTRESTKTKRLPSLGSKDSVVLSTPTSSLSTEYRPSSVVSFLSRLSTFKLSSYANKPLLIDAVAASKCGWINTGKDRLACGICGASWVVAGRDGMSRDAANALVEKQHTSLIEAHKPGCPWKTRQCDPSIYRIPLQPPTATVKGIKAVAISLSELLKDVIIVHPLTQAQVNSVKETIITYSPLASLEGEQPIETGPPSEQAILTSLFGWRTVSTTSQDLRRSKSSFSKSYTPTPGSPGCSISRASTPSHDTSVKFGLSSIKRDTLLQCTLCQRRIGLWTFLPDPSIIKLTSGGGTDLPTSTSQRTTRQRQFNLLHEHRSYCPYVVRSTTIPTLPVPLPQSELRDSDDRFQSIPHHDGTSMEGWRAVLTVVLRYNWGQKYISDYNIFASKGESNREYEDAMEVKEVKAMIACVKSRGGKDLLKYVRDLFD